MTDGRWGIKIDYIPSDGISDRGRKDKKRRKRREKRRDGRERLKGEMVGEKEREREKMVEVDQVAIWGFEVCLVPNSLPHYLVPSGTPQKPPTFCTAATAKTGKSNTTQKRTHLTHNPIPSTRPRN